ncbi:MAG: hypothetical protein AAF384_14530, partial [Pseudomonadota bacterium]
ENERFLDDMQDSTKVFRQGGLQPGWLLRQANLIVDANYDLGPWIHTESQIKNHARGQIGQPIKLTAKLIQLFERKGHQYADLDIAMLDEKSELLARVMHRFIYKTA